MTNEELSARDYYLLIDKSISMSETDTPTGQTRWQYAQEQTLNIARKCMEFDPNGIDVCVFSGVHKLYQDVTADKVKQIFTENSPGQSTNTAGALKAVFDLHNERKAKGTGKPATIIVMTDGIPDDKAALAKVIIDQTNTMEKDEEVGISFMQVGKDADARKFLETLDNDLVSKGAKFDIVDTRNDEEMNSMGVEEILAAAVED